MTMNQNAALTDAHAQPSASSRPNIARRRVCRVVPGRSACWAIVLQLHRRFAPAFSYSTVIVPVIVVGWAWQRNGYSPAASAGIAYERSSGPVKRLVSPIGTASPAASLTTTLCGAVASWLSKTSVNCVSAGACSSVGSKPVVAAPVGAVTVTDSALGSIDAPALGPGVAPGPPVSASVQHAGYGVAP